jgi:hypothetical protein
MGTLYDFVVIVPGLDAYAVYLYSGPMDGDYRISHRCRHILIRADLPADCVASTIMTAVGIAVATYPFR